MAASAKGYSGVAGVTGKRQGSLGFDFTGRQLFRGREVPQSTGANDHASPTVECKIDHNNAGGRKFGSKGTPRCDIARSDDFVGQVVQSWVMSEQHDMPDVIGCCANQFDQLTVVREIKIITHLDNLFFSDNMLADQGERLPCSNSGRTKD